MSSTESTFADSTESATDWDTAGPHIDQLWDDFVEKESELTGPPKSDLVKPAGNGPILFALNYAPKNDTMSQDYGSTINLRQPCIRGLATGKMKLGDSEQALHQAGRRMETNFRKFGFKMAEAGGSPPYKKVLSKEAVALHHELHYDLWRASDTKLALLSGAPSYDWHKNTSEMCSQLPSQTQRSSRSRLPYE